MKGRNNKKPIAYVSFTTFLAVLERLKGTRLGAALNRERCGIRQQSSWEQLSGSFRALQLLDEDDKPTTALKRLIRGNRKSELRKILERQYPEVFGADPTRIGTAKLEQILGSNFGVRASTKTRARSFLLRALRYCEVPVSPELSRKTRHRVEKNPTLQIYPSNSSRDTIVSHTEDGATITVAIQAGTWPEIETVQGVLIDRLVDELKSFKKGTTKTKRPHLTSVKS